MSDWPEVLWVADVNMPPVLERLIAEPLVAPAGFSFEGCVRKAKASFSDLKGIETRAPVSSPSVTTAILPPGYCFWSWVLADAMSAALKPDTEAPLVPCISDFGNRNFIPTVTEPSALNVALVS